MKIETAAALLIDGLKTVQVRYQNNPSKTYTFKTVEDLIAGDLVLVPSGADNTIKVVEVVSVDPSVVLDVDSDIEYKWVIGKVDLTNYNHITQVEVGLVQKLTEAKNKAVVNQARQALLSEYGMNDADVLQLTQGVKVDESA